MRISDWSSDVCSSDLGYKLHVAVDAGSGLVRALATTPANVQEVALARELVQGDELMVYADRGYDAAWLHDHLAAQGIADGIMRRARRHPILDPAAIVRNPALSLRPGREGVRVGKSGSVRVR